MGSLTSPQTEADPELSGSGNKVFLLLLFWCLWYVNFTSRTLFAPILPILEDEFAITHALAGGLFAFLSMGYTVTLLLSGLFAPRVGFKVTILLGSAVLLLSILALRYAASYAAFAAAAFCVGLGGGVYLPSAIPLLTSMFEPRNWGKAIALHDTAAHASILSVPLLVSLALTFLSWRSLFTLLGTLSLLTLLAFWAFSPSRPAENEPSRAFWTMLRRREFWLVGVLWVFGAANGLGLYNVIPLFLVKENGILLQTANTLFGLSRIGGFVVAVLAGLLTDRYGVRRVLAAFVLLTGLSSMGLALVRPFPLLAILLVLQATLSAGFFPIALVAISRLTDMGDRSLFTGAAIALGVMFGLGLTPFVLGAVADVWSFRAGILLLGILTAFSSLLVGRLRV